MLERLHKILARAGVAALRPSEDLILQGRVTVNGKVVRELGARADADTDVIAVDGQLIEVPKPTDPHRYIMLYKPPEVISTAHDTHDRPTVVDLVPNDARLFPVGRLDADSEGLILLTDDGDLAYRLTHPRFNVEKEYRVLVDRTPELDALRRWRTGVELEDGYVTLPAWVEVVERSPDGSWLRVVLREGRKRQIREVARLLGLHVLRLIRVREGPLNLGDLAQGSWRELTQSEVEALRAHTQHVPSREADEAHQQERMMDEDQPGRTRRLRVIRRVPRDGGDRMPDHQADTERANVDMSSTQGFDRTERAPRRPEPDRNEARGFGRGTPPDRPRDQFGQRRDQGQWNNDRRSSNADRRTPTQQDRGGPRGDRGFGGPPRRDNDRDSWRDNPQRGNVRERPSPDREGNRFEEDRPQRTQRSAGDRPHWNDRDRSYGNNREARGDVDRPPRDFNQRGPSGGRSFDRPPVGNRRTDDNAGRDPRDRRGEGPPRENRWDRGENRPGGNRPAGRSFGRPGGTRSEGRSFGRPGGSGEYGRGPGRSGAQGPGERSFGRPGGPPSGRSFGRPGGGGASSGRSFGRPGGTSGGRSYGRPSGPPSGRSYGPPRGRPGDARPSTRRDEGGPRFGEDRPRGPQTRGGFGGRPAPGPRRGPPRTGPPARPARPGDRRRRDDDE